MGHFPGLRRRRHVLGRLLHLHRGLAPSTQVWRFRLPALATACVLRTSFAAARKPRAAMARAAGVGHQAQCVGTQSRPQAVIPRAHAERPRRASNGWVLNGSKTFITHGRVGHVTWWSWRSPTERQLQRHLRLHRRARCAWHAGGKKEDKLGMQASDKQVLFEQCEFRQIISLGDEVRGFVNTMRVLDAGRIGIAALSVGLARKVRMSSARIRERAKGVSEDDQRLSRPFSGNSSTPPADWGRPPSDLSCRLSQDAGRHDPRIFDGQSCMHRRLPSKPPTMTACNPRWLRFREGLPAEKVLP